MSRALLALCSVVVDAALCISWILWPAGGPPEPVDLGGPPVAGVEADAAASIIDLDSRLMASASPRLPGAAEALKDQVPPGEPVIELGDAPPVAARTCCCTGPADH